MSGVSRRQMETQVRYGGVEKTGYGDLGGEGRDVL